MNKSPKIAIIADWLTNQGGAEKVIFDLYEIFPTATIFTSIYNPEKLPQFKNANIVTSFIQNLPFAKNKHQLYLNLMPFAFESFDLSDYDIVISSSFACAKGIITKPETLHISYCHTPMRYIWDESHQYIKEHNLNAFLKFIATPFLHKIRMWDQLTANRPDKFIANSKYVSERILKYYNRKSKVIHPGTDFYQKSIQIQNKKSNFYLTAGRLKPFKRFDLIIKAFNLSNNNLVVVGEGEDLERLEKLNTNPNTTFTGFVSTEKLQKLYSSAKGFIFPQAEDFGITPLEAQYQGCPVIAFAKGGALETVKDNQTGIFFKNQTTKDLNEKIHKFEKLNFNYEQIHKNSLKFTSKIFQVKIKSYIEEEYSKYLKA